MRPGDRPTHPTPAVYPDWIDLLRRVERLDFNILAPGHGAMDTKEQQFPLGSRVVGYTGVIEH